jgi:hypothetical protein
VDRNTNGKNLKVLFILKNMVHIAKSLLNSAAAPTKAEKPRGIWFST